MVTYMTMMMLVTIDRPILITMEWYGWDDPVAIHSPSQFLALPAHSECLTEHGCY